MSRRHYTPNSNDNYNIITGNDSSPQERPRYENLSNQDFSLSNDNSQHFETTSKLIGQSTGEGQARGAYYGRQKKTNEFYSKTGVFNAPLDSDGSEHPLGKNLDLSSPVKEAPQQEGTKYSRYY